MFAESLVLAWPAALGGVALAWMASRAADLVLTPGFRALPFRGEVPITDRRAGAVFAARGGARVGGAVWIRAAPRPAATRNPQALLREGERGSTGVANAARRALVAVEVALAIVVLCGAGLLIKSLAGLLQVSPGSIRAKC